MGWNRKIKAVESFRHPAESVWFGIQPLLSLGKIIGIWPCISFQAPDSEGTQKGQRFFCHSCLGKDSFLFMLHMILSFYIATVNTIGERHTPHRSTEIKFLSYMNIIANGMLHILARLLTVATLPKLVRFLNKIAHLDNELQVYPKECLALRRRSWAILAWLVLAAIMYLGFSSVNFNWWRIAGQSDIAGVLGVILPPIHVVSSVTLIMILVQLLNTLEHRFRVVTSEAIEILKTAESNTIHFKRPLALIERVFSGNGKQTERSPAETRISARQLRFFCDLSGILVGCVIPIQVFLIITDSFGIVRKFSTWIVENRMLHLFSVVLRVVCWTTDILAIFWAADKMKSQMVGISRAIQKHSFLGLQPDEQLQIQLLSSLASRCKTDIRPAGFFALSCSVIPALIANFTTFFIVQFQTYTAADGIEPSKKNSTL